MKNLAFAAATAVAVVLSGTASAQQVQLAQLSGIQGKVFVDSGQGFAPVGGPVSLKTGDRVMVAGLGGALLTYGADCSLPLAADSITTVDTSTACVVSTQGRGQGRSFGLPQTMMLGATGFFTPVFIHAMIKEQPKSPTGVP
jgi:hypothetical protein